MEMEVRDDDAVRVVTAWILQLPNHFSYSKRNMPHVPHLQPHMTHTHSLRTGVRQRCACIFLVFNYLGMAFTDFDYTIMIGTLH